LPDFAQCRKFLNADLIAAGLSPFTPETQAMRAGRLLLIRIKELAEARQDFSFETTMAGRSYVRLISGLRQSGYNVILFFLWLPSAEMAMARVASRVRKGGHGVPEPTIRRRFQAGLRNFFQLYAPLVNSWYLLDGSHLPPSLVADRSDGALQTHQPELFQMIETLWGN
jgi:predicted ABC-type ATPase